MVQGYADSKTVIGTENKISKTSSNLNQCCLHKLHTNASKSMHLPNPSTMIKIQQTNCFTKVKNQSALLFTNCLEEKEWIHAFPKGICEK